MNTIEELEAYLEENCYSFIGLSIGKHRAQEGIIIEKYNEKYIYAYSERGNKSIIKSFNTEKELVQYALTELMRDEWSRAHIVASTFELKEILEAEEQIFLSLADLRKSICILCAFRKIECRLFGLSVIW